MLEKAGFKVEDLDKEIDYSLLKETQEVELIKELQKFEDVLKRAATENEPSILAK